MVYQRTFSTLNGGQYRNPELEKYKYIMRSQTLVSSTTPEPTLQRASQDVGGKTVRVTILGSLLYDCIS